MSVDTCAAMDSPLAHRAAGAAESGRHTLQHIDIFAFLKGDPRPTIVFDYTDASNGSDTSNCVKPVHHNPAAASIDG